MNCASLVIRLRYATAAAAALLLAALSFSTIYKPSSGECNNAPREVRYIPAKARTAPISAYVSPGVGLMVAKDLDGRPVGELSIARHDVRIEILDGVAKTTIEEIFVNHTDKRLEGTFHFPLPADASISRLAMEINGKLMEGTCLERQRAREVYEGIVRKMCDPALLEWMPGNIFKCRIFPIDPRGEKRVIIGYTQALPYFDGRMKYVYPLASEKAKEHALGRVSIEAALKFKGSLKRVECPSHRADVAMKDAHEATARYEARDLRPENDFVLDLQLDDRQEFTRVPHKLDGEDGYFMALYTPQGKRERIAAPRKVAFVVDISASVSGADLEVSRSLVQACLDKLGEKDSFVIISHHIETTRFAGSKREALTFLADLKTGGASDLLAALKAAAAERPDEIVYIGKGVPTFGEREKFDLDFAGSLRTIAVGNRTGTELLDRLALQYRGASFAINPSDFVAARIREIVSTFGAELITDIRVEGSEVIYDLAPAKPRNLYAGERLVLTGRFRASGGNLNIAGREFACAFPAKEEGNNFVRRLWAQRKIAELLAAGEAKKADVVALSVKHQIMTPFTSFLVLENEEAYKQWNIDRQKQEQDKLLAKKKEAEAESAAHEIATKREVMRKIARLLELSYVAFDQQNFDKCGKLCDEILLIDPRYTVATELKEDTEKARRRPEFAEFIKKKIDAWKQLTHDDEEATIPYSETIRFPSRSEWASISLRISESIMKPQEEGARKEVIKQDLKHPDDAEWDDLIRSLKEQHTASEQEKGVRAGEHYKLAERYYQAGYFEKAELEAQRALRLNPNDAAAQALQIELNFVWGRGNATPQSEDLGKIMSQAVVRQQQTVLEMEKAYGQGVRAFNLGEYEKAEREFKTVLEYAKWMPTGEEMEQQRRRALTMVDKTITARTGKEPDGLSADEAWLRIAEEAARGRTVGERQAIGESERHHDLALSYYRKGDFEKARLEAQSAVGNWQSNLAARELLNRIDSLMIGRQEGAGNDNPADGRVQEIQVKIQQSELEIANHIRTGERYYNARMYGDAEREFEEADFKIKHVPYEVKEMKDLAPQVERYVRKAREARLVDQNRDLEKPRATESEARVRWPMLESEKRKDELRREIQRTRELEILFGQAQVHFEREEYERCEEICKRLQDLNPNLTTVAEMRMVAMRLRSTKESRDNLRNYVAEWKRTFEQVELQGVVQSNVLEFPDRAAWESIRRDGTSTAETRDTFGAETTNNLSLGIQDFPGVDVELIERQGSARNHAANWMTSTTRLGDLPSHGFDVPNTGLTDIDEQAVQPGAAGSNSGPGFISQETARLQAWDVRAQSFQTLLKRDALTGIGVDFIENRRAGRDPHAISEELKARKPKGLAELDGEPTRPDSVDELHSLVQALRTHEKQLAELDLVEEDYRVKLVKSINEKVTAVQELEYRPRGADRMSRDLADLEDRRIGILKEKRRLEEVLNHLNNVGLRTDFVAPVKPLEGKVNAVSPEIGLVIVSIGKVAGVLEGQEFTVYRGGNFVAKIVIDRVDGQWSAGKVVLKGYQGDPLVADEVSNHILISGGTSGGTVDSDDAAILMKLREIRISLDEKEKTLPQVVDLLREMTGLNFLIDRKGVLENPEEVRLTIKFSETPLEGALAAMLSSRQLAYYVQGGVVIVTPAETLRKRVRLEVYDVHDLSSVFLGFRGFNKAWSAAARFNRDDLAAWLKKQVFPKEWEETNGKSATLQNGHLIVRNTHEVHLGVRLFLANLRKPLECGEGTFVGGVVAAGENGVILDKGAASGVERGQLFAVTRLGRFVAFVVISRIQEERAAAEVWSGAVIGRMRPGDKATQIVFPAAYIAALPKEVKFDFASQRGLDRIRAGLELERKAAER